jgi:hypothetical protein
MEIGLAAIDRSALDPTGLLSVVGRADVAALTGFR